MRELLSFGYAQLFQTKIRNIFSEGILYIFLVEHHVQSFESRIVWSHTIVLQRQSMHVEFRHVLLGKHNCKFFCTVVAIVEENYNIAGFNLCQRFSGRIHYYYRFYEFVGNAGIVGGLHGFGCIVVRCPFGMYK